MRDLGTLGGQDSAGLAINARGSVTGGAQYTPGWAGTHAFLYVRGKMQDLGTLGGDVSEGLAINNQGEIVGRAALPGYGGDRAFLYRKSVMTDLNTLIDASSALAPPRVTLYEAIGINDEGSIVANGIDNNYYTTHAYLLTPARSRHAHQP